MTVEEITLYLVKLPLTTPYHVSYRVYEDFDPIVVEARDKDGRVGWGEGHVSPGYSHETIEGAWAFCREHAEKMIGKDADAAKAHVIPSIPASPVAASALITAIEMLERNPALEVSEEARLPLLAPFHATRPEEIAAEVEERLAEGFRTLKVKVGKDVNADLARVGAVQAAARGRATLRLDANRGFSKSDGCRFASSVDPDGIELFEQPCAAGDWEANGAVAAVSTVPVMLDESIYSLADIERAAGMKGVGFVKLKLKKLGGLDLLRAGLTRIRARAMEPVLGDGVAAEIGCWMEACVARGTIANAGEFNGFLKPRARLFVEPLVFENGAIVLRPGFAPEIDRKALERHTLAVERFARPRAARPAAAR
ncbi:MAG: enolase C-terminal domain-like protein [Alphaproteobacteria bacterium]